MESKVKEDFEMTFKESPKSRVLDYAFSVNTMTSGEVSYETELINGTLDGIIICSKNQIQLSISLKDLDIPLFEIQSIQGDNFISLGNGVIDAKGEHFRDCFSKWSLNDKLVFRISGPLNSEVKFVVRYS